MKVLKRTAFSRHAHQLQLDLTIGALFHVLGYAVPVTRGIGQRQQNVKNGWRQG
jgi:hypothetical protein